MFQTLPITDRDAPFWQCKSLRPLQHVPRGSLKPPRDDVGTPALGPADSAAPNTRNRSQEPNGIVPETDFRAIALKRMMTFSTSTEVNSIAQMKTFLPE